MWVWERFWTALNALYVTKPCIQPPVLVSTCWESVIGCEGCIQTWMSNHPSCSKCRSENDFIAIKLKGFDIISRLNKSFTWQIEARKHYFCCVQSNMLLHPTTVVNAFEKLKVTNLTWKIYASWLSRNDTYTKIFYVSLYLNLQCFFLPLCINP